MNDLTLKELELLIQRTHTEHGNVDGFGSPNEHMVIPFVRVEARVLEQLLREYHEMARDLDYAERNLTAYQTAFPV